VANTDNSEEAKSDSVNVAKMSNTNMMGKDLKVAGLV